MAEYSLHYFDDIPLEELLDDIRGDEIVTAIHGLEHQIGAYFDDVITRYDIES